MRVAVIGSGAAGCAAAYRLSRRGHDAVVFERDAAIGGRTRSWRQDGRVVDSGAGFFTNFYPMLHALAREVGLADAIQSIPRTTALLHDGIVGALDIGSVSSLLAYPFASARAKLRMAAAKL